MCTSCKHILCTKETNLIYTILNATKMVPLENNLVLTEKKKKKTQITPNLTYKVLCSFTIFCSYCITTLPTVSILQDCQLRISLKEYSRCTVLVSTDKESWSGRNCYHLQMTSSFTATTVIHAAYIKEAHKKRES